MEVNDKEVNFHDLQINEEKTYMTDQQNEEILVKITI